ncbi:MAG: NBR1-Ig-like domain-containing protein [Anaerolineae bacterium]
MKPIPARLWIGLVLALTAGACVLFAPEEPSLTPTEEPSPVTETVTIAATEEPLPPPTETSVPPTVTEDVAVTSTATSGSCPPDARFVSDVTFPDDTVIDPGVSFRKTWRLRNSGACAWKVGTRLVFVGGDPLGGPTDVTVPPADAGATVDLSVDLLAPTTPGTYRSEWRLQAPDGARFGPTIYVQIVVPGQATVTPTSALTPEETGCEIPYDSAFAATLDYATSLGFDVGCPQGAAYDVSGAAQVFWANVEHPNPHMHYRTLMIWNTPYKQGEIYYVTVSETSPVQPFHAAYDTWEEGMPETRPACAGMTVPDGYLMPIRGFGKLWCDGELWESIGWPREPEIGLNFLVQPTEGGRLMRFGDPLLNTYVVVWDYDSNEALVQMNPPAP